MQERSLQNTNFVFVGGSSGIGLATATALAQRGAAILIVGRSARRGAQAISRIRAAGGQRVDFVTADLLSVAGMQDAVGKIQAWRPVLHGLVHSAMQSAFQRFTTPDGFDLAFGLQYLARYALNRALVELLAASGDGRIVQIGAKAPSGLLPDLDDLQFQRRKWRMLPSLMSSQVLGYLHAQEAAKRWQGKPVTIAITAVGPTMTDTVREQAPLWVRLLYRLIATTPERSAANAIRLLTMADASAANGTIFFSAKRFEATPLRYGHDLTERLWTLSEDLLRTRGFAL